MSKRTRNTACLYNQTKQRLKKNLPTYLIHHFIYLRNKLYQKVLVQLRMTKIKLFCSREYSKRVYLIV